ncbi:hypothetical protein EF879_20345 [Micromonospora sp. HM5-17]|nr:hypothetical protein EF879_20345 [Micromonospora sp. HM5-17]
MSTQQQAARLVSLTTERLFQRGGTQQRDTHALELASWAVGRAGTAALRPERGGIQPQTIPTPIGCSDQHRRTTAGPLQN